MSGTTGNSPQMYDWLMKSGRDRNISDLKTDRTGPPGPQIVERGGHRGEERRGDLPHTHLTALPACLIRGFCATRKSWSLDAVFLRGERLAWHC